MMKKFFLLCFVLSGFSELSGQMIVQLPKHGAIVNYAGYNYTKVELGDYANEILGHALGVKGQKTAIKTSNSLEKEILGFIQKPYKAGDVPFLFYINSISFSEKQVSATKAMGRAALEVEIYSIRDGIRKKVYTARAGNNYEHSLNILKKENYEGLLDRKSVV